MRFGIINLKISFSFASALFFHYICNVAAPLARRGRLGGSHKLWKAFT